PEADSFRNGWMAEQRFINFPGRDFFTSPIDQFFDAADQSQVAVGVEITLVPGSKPAACERRRVGLRIPFVAAENVRSLDRHLSMPSRPQDGSLLVQDRYLNVSAAPD